ncbi:MAG: flagellar biosynthetic protein FliO [Roseburia sp.]|nr:flagellar biosynthetic protein FliO [Roseburia sp.]MCM1096982.1 flagellar biosynthetic protein FliO [Ruminococcus flavefaciens]
MTILLTGTTDVYAQFITVLIVFVLVLALTALVTKWIAGYQKQQSANTNIEVMETARIANNKYIQIVRIGESYAAIAVCRDTVTLLGIISGEELKTGSQSQGFSFRDFLEKAMGKTGTESIHTGDGQSDEEA